MTRVKHAVSSRRHRKKVLKAAKGQFTMRSRGYRIAKEAVRKGMIYSYIDRKKKKRNFRALWISRIGAACKMEGLSYSNFVSGLRKAGITLNRKVLAHIANEDKGAFKFLVKKAKA